MARTIKAGNRRVSSSELSNIRKKPGMSNAGKYKTKKTAGPNGTFPINTIARGRNALARLHLAAPEYRQSIKNAVYAEYPSLREVEK